ncbi:MAG: MBL fold metallo-hydrolase [Candidatus Latescibacteria bacterium]|nr:MBL fold metallo-hydrolase [Candidatus Latescibacterota bacterium]
MSENTITITVLVENTVSREELKAEHGLSVWIETRDGNILWDTGQTTLLIDNAQKLGIPLDTTDFIVLSHGHYDHTGGLLQVLLMAPQAQVYGHPGLFVQRYSQNKKSAYTVNPIGSPVQKELIESRCGSLNLCSGPVEILPGIFTTGEIPRETFFEDTGGDFFLDTACSKPDRIPDDQALYIESSQGIIVLLGCAHSGVVNTLDYVSKHTGSDKIFAVLGGMHLLRASQERLEATAEAFTRYDVRMIAPCHCSGIRAVTFIKSKFPDRFIECSTGSRYIFGNNQ